MTKKLSFLKVKYSQFDTEELLKELSLQYDLPQDSKCIFYKTGLNDIYKVTSKCGDYYLRISLSNVYSTLQIEEEIQFILHLLKSGISVVEPIQCKNGSYILELNAPEGMRQAVLFHGIEQSPMGEADTLYNNLGELVAKMHIASRTYNKTSVRLSIDEKMLVKEPSSYLNEYLKHRPDDLDFLNKTAMALWDSADKMLSKYDDLLGYCHGDIQPSNYFFKEDRPVIFDFDCMGWGYFAYDLGVLLANLTFHAEDIYEKTVWCAFIDGYNSVRQLNEDEKKSIYIFAALHLLRVLSYHAKCREGNQGAVYFMTDHHLNIFFGAYKRLTNLAIEKSELRIL